jgi:hypothetical protein
MSFAPASRENAITKAYHSLTLIAGLEATIENKARPVDLNVLGGGIFHRNLVVCGNIDVGDFLNGNVDGNIFTNYITASNSSQGITVIGDLIIDDDYTLTANVISANTIVNNNGDDLTLEATDMIILNSPTVVVTGNIEADRMCAPIIQTDLLEPKSGTTLDIGGDVNLLDGRIVSPQTITICNDGDLILKPTGFVIISNIAQELDLSKQVISNVLAIEAASGCDLSLKADPGYTIDIACGDGIDMMGRDIFMNNGNIVGLQNIMPYGNENIMVCGNLEIKSGDFIVNGGNIVFAGGDLDLDNGNIKNVQNIVPTSGGNVLICGNLEVKNGGDIIINDGDMIVNQGDIVVNEGDLDLTGGNITNVTNITPAASGTGNVLICGNLEIKNGGDIVVNEGDVIVNEGRGRSGFDRWKHHKCHKHHACHIRYRKRSGMWYS